MHLIKDPIIEIRNPQIKFKSDKNLRVKYSFPINITLNIVTIRGLLGINNNGIVLTI
jgi:ABC-type antimicrobial peptide transport system ATPase subunit